MAGRKGRSGLSVVVISRDEGAYLRKTVENLADTLPPDGDIVVVDDGSEDGSTAFLKRRRAKVQLIRGEGLGVAKARNLGARASRGGMIVFADAHIEAARDWWRPLVELAGRPEVGAAAPGITHMTKAGKAGYGLTFQGPSLDVRWFKTRPKNPRAVPILPGCCTMMRRDVFEAVGGWDEGMLQRGNVDNEGCIRLWLYGYELLVTGETEVSHLFRERSPYQVAWPNYLQNRLRLAFAHLSPPRVGKVVAALRGLPLFGQAMLLLMAGGIAERRNEVAGRRVRDDYWLFERFGWRW